ncbi:MAG: adenosylcobinamide amidohydrolase [Oscillochloris sp.]|nr:adenosylcobinamide amidohydrolase [Oscillochloris sp.]
MLIGRYYDGVEIHRAEKILYARFVSPHRVISTCRSSAGGLRDDLGYLFNHQSCEPNNHEAVAELHALAIEQPDVYRALIASRHGLPPERCATLGTAANMQAAALAHEAYRDLEVLAICTAGVGSSAGRAGDPASYYEEGGSFVLQPAPNAGTIVIMLCISRELRPGAMVEAVTMATEAKVAILQELSVGSCSSAGLATGTGTDQIAIAARCDGAGLSGAGKYTRLGELIARTVQRALRQALAQQNGLTTTSQRHCLALLKRLGASESALCEAICAHLSPHDAELLRPNLDVVLMDPLTVAAVAALLHLRDQLIWEVLPPGCLPEVLTTYAAQVAAAVASQPQRVVEYQQMLAATPATLSTAGMLDLVAQAIGLGFRDKWTHLIRAR